jgi:hypothetical protein
MVKSNVVIRKVHSEMKCVKWRRGEGESVEMNEVTRDCRSRTKADAVWAWGSDLRARNSTFGIYIWYLKRCDGPIGQNRITRLQTTTKRRRAKKTQVTGSCLMDRDSSRVDITNFLPGNIPQYNEMQHRMWKMIFGKLPDLEGSKSHSCGHSHEFFGGAIL